MNTGLSYNEEKDFENMAQQDAHALYQEEQRIAELMKPRYLAISPNEKHYPGSFWQVGDIIDASGKLTKFDDYPHLFEPLEWYSYRRTEHMPDFIKTGKKVGKVVEHFVSGGQEFCKAEFFNGHTTEIYNCYYMNFLPATLAEYQQYINSKQQP